MLASTEAARWKEETAQMKARALMAEERALVAEANAEEYRKRAAAEVEKLDRLKQTVRTQIEEAVASSTATHKSKITPDLSLYVYTEIINPCVPMRLWWRAARRWPFGAEVKFINPCWPKHVQ